LRGGGESCCVVVAMVVVFTLSTFVLEAAVVGCAVFSLVKEVVVSSMVVVESGKVLAVFLRADVMATIVEREKEL
jgi:hypothetical protein